MEKTTRFIWLNQLVVAVLCFLVGMAIGFGPGEVVHRVDYLWFWRIRRPTLAASPSNFDLERIKRQPAPAAKKQLQDWLYRYPESWSAPKIALAWQELLLAGGDRNSACLYLATARQKWGNSPVFSFWAIRWSEALVRHGEKEMAWQILQELVAQNNWVMPEALRQSGALAATEKKWLQARRYWDLLAVTFPDSPAAQEIQGPLALLRIERNEVVTDGVKVQAARYLARRNLFDRALAILIPASSEDISYCRLQILLQSRRYPAAVAAAQSFLANYPQSHRREDALRCLARIFAIKTKQPDLAIACYRRLLDQCSDRRRQAATFLAMGDCHVALGQDRQAAEAYRQAVSYSNNPHLQQAAYYSLANVSQRRGEAAQAVAYLELAAQHIQGRHILAVTRMLTSLYKKNGQGDKALASLEKLLSREWNDDNRREILIAAGKLAIELGKVGKARNYLQQARQSMPVNYSRRQQLEELLQKLPPVRNP